MDEKFQIKLEMAQMAYRGKRFSESEKIIEEIIFSDDSSVDKKSLAWAALGSVKSAKFRNEEASLEEISYSFEKSRAQGNTDADSLYATEIIGILAEYYFLIKELEAKRKEIDKSKWTKAFMSVISAEIASSVGWNNSSLKIGLMGVAAAKAIDYYSDRITAENIPLIILDIKKKFEYVLLNYNAVYNFRSEDVLNEILQFIKGNKINNEDFNKPQSKFYNLQLSDGRVLEIHTELTVGYTVGDEVFLDGTSAPDGKYKIAWLQSILIENGKIKSL